MIACNPLAIIATLTKNLCIGCHVECHSIQFSSVQFRSIQFIHAPMYQTSTPRISNLVPSSDKGSLPKVRQDELTPFSTESSIQRP